MNMKIKLSEIRYRMLFNFENDTTLKNIIDKEVTELLKTSEYLAEKGYDRYEYDLGQMEKELDSLYRKNDQYLTEPMINYIKEQIVHSLIMQGLIPERIYKDSSLDKLIITWGY